VDRRTLAFGLLAVVVVAAAAVFALSYVTGRDAERRAVEGPSESPFTMTRPSGWKELADQEREALPGSPLAVLRREDGKGIAIVGKEASRSRDFDKLSRELDRELPKSFSDFEKVTSHTIAVKAGQAFLYSYTRKKKGTANSVVVVPAKSGRFTINTVVTGGAVDVARQVGAMIRSFDTRPSGD
jgi:hypothetical protein